MVNHQSLYSDMPNAPRGMDRLHWGWDRLVKSVFPADNAIDLGDPERIAQQIADWAGVEVGTVKYVRQIRNKCSHPVKAGWPTQEQLDRALELAQEIWQARELEMQGRVRTSNTDTVFRADDTRDQFERLMSGFSRFLRN